MNDKMFNRAENSAAMDWNGYQSHLQRGGRPLVAAADKAPVGQFSIVKFVIYMLVAAAFGAAIMSNGAVSVGNLIQAISSGTMPDFMLALAANDGWFRLGCGAGFGALIGGGLYSLAVSSPEHHGAPRPMESMTT